MFMSSWFCWLPPVHTNRSLNRTHQLSLEKAGEGKEKKMLLERQIMKCSSCYFVNSIRDVIQAQLTALSTWLCVGLTAPTASSFDWKSVFAGVAALCPPHSGCPTSNSASTASVEVSQLLFSHNSGSTKLSYTNGKKRSLLFLWNQVLLLVSSSAEPYGSYDELPITNVKMGERMSGLGLPSETLKDWVHSPGHLSPSSAPYLDSLYLSNNNSNTSFATWRIHRP